ncbi:hypothetical protein ACFQ6N_03575 [Kitasatospora sp. NPDC056446]|uniref:hypothetical protein n=1 Tax=Kitasatospora sp. NPDC056446 TaxID=3345819 RepID=UPI0036C7A9C5
MGAKPLALVLAALSLAVPAAPAFAGTAADGGDGSSPSRPWNLTAAAGCLPKVATVPVLGGSLGDHVEECGNGDAVSHALG